MLTQSELAWLNERQICLACEGSYLWGGYWEEGVELEVMKDAAEFEAQVAALIANLYGDKFANVVLKHARLQVEEEMDNEP